MTQKIVFFLPKFFLSLILSDPTYFLDPTFFVPIILDINPYCSVMRHRPKCTSDYSGFGPTCITLLFGEVIIGIPCIGDIILPRHLDNFENYASQPF